MDSNKNSHESQDAIDERGTGTDYVRSQNNQRREDVNETQGIDKRKRDLFMRELDKSNDENHKRFKATEEDNDPDKNTENYKKGNLKNMEEKSPNLSKLGEIRDLNFEYTNRMKKKTIITIKR